MNDINIEVSGPVGCGKSELVAVIAKAIVAYCKDKPAVVISAEHHVSGKLVTDNREEIIANADDALVDAHHTGASVLRDDITHIRIMEKVVR